MLDTQASASYLPRPFIAAPPFSWGVFMCRAQREQYVKKLSK